MTLKEKIKEYVDDHYKYYAFYPYDVEANSEEEARSILEQNIGHFYVVTDRGEQLANDSWEVGELDEIDDYYDVEEGE